MKLTLTYRGALPPKQRGVSPVKSELRRAFHPQIKAQVEHLLAGKDRQYVSTTVGGAEFLSPAHRNFRTAVELDILLLSPRSIRAGDVDNRLKTLVDGLTRPANAQQMQGFVAPADGGPTYCLCDDDKLVRRIGLDTRSWHDPDASAAEALVVVTATMVLGENADMTSPVGNIFLTL